MLAADPKLSAVARGRSRRLSGLRIMLHSVETIQVVLGSALLRATDGAAKRARVNRSALVREALRAHLKRLDMRELEARDRQGYAQHPDASIEATEWERVAAWPAMDSGLVSVRGLCGGLGGIHQQSQGPIDRLLAGKRPRKVRLNED